MMTRAEVHRVLEKGDVQKANDELIFCAYIIQTGIYAKELTSSADVVKSKRYEYDCYKENVLKGIPFDFFSSLVDETISQYGMYMIDYYNEKWGN